MILIKNGTVITFDEKNPLIKRGGVVVEGDRIVDVGPWEELQHIYCPKEQRDAQGKIIMPGLYIPHYHLYSTFARGLPSIGPAPRDFSHILKNLWWQLDLLLNEEDIYYSALLGLVELVKKGCVGLFDHHASPSFIEGSLDAIAAAVSEVGITAALCYEVTDRHGLEGAQEGIAENLRFMKKYANDPLLGAHFGLHASMTLSPETLTDCQQYGEQLGVGFHVHTAEAAIDVEDAEKQYQLGVVERLDRYGIWNQKSLAIHAVHVSDEDISCLKQRGVTVIHNPCSNMNNGVGTAPLHRMFQEGLLVGLGTDAWTADPFLELKTGYLLQNHHLENPGAGACLLEVLFKNNPQIISSVFPQVSGMIKRGHLADILILHHHPPTPFTQENILYHMLYGFSGDQVDLVMSKGQILVENRELLSPSLERLHRKGREQAQDFWERWDTHVLSAP